MSEGELVKRQVKSKQRVADHGEVFTAEREVNAMLDLVKSETERIDSKTRKLIEENAVLELSSGGNELFGWAWNKEKTDESDK